MNGFNEIKKNTCENIYKILLFSCFAILFTRIESEFQFHWELDRNRKQIGAKGTK